MVLQMYHGMSAKVAICYSAPQSQTYMQGNLQREKRKRQKKYQKQQQHRRRRPKKTNETNVMLVQCLKYTQPHVKHINIDLCETNRRY